MILYRVDKRRFNNGDIITPHTTFEKAISSLQLEVEESLDELSPSCVPARKECLFLFCDLSSALIFCSKYGGYIYAVTIEKDDIYHRADMNMLDNVYDVFKITECKDVRAAVVNRYWEDGAHTFQPCYEFLVKQAKVISVIFDQDLKDLIKSEISSSSTIENTHIFKSIFNK